MGDDEGLEVTALGCGRSSRSVMVVRAGRGGSWDAVSVVVVVLKKLVEWSKKVVESASRDVPEISLLLVCSSSTLLSGSVESVSSHVLLGVGVKP